MKGSRWKLRTLCETRWASRADSLYTFRVSFPVVVHALEQLQQDGDEKAGQLIPCRYFKIRIYYRACSSGTHFKINRPFIDMFARSKMGSGRSGQRE